MGKLLEMGVKLGRQTRPDLEIGICGEHGGEPSSVEFCYRVGIGPAESRLRPQKAAPQGLAVARWRWLTRGACRPVRACPPWRCTPPWLRGPH